MNFRNKIKQLEKRRWENETAWLESLSDAELEKLIEGQPEIPHFDECFDKWIKTLTDNELLIVRENRRGAARLERKFYEYYQKQNKKA
jgi:hypothetical protein